MTNEKFLYLKNILKIKKKQLYIFIFEPFGYFELKATNQTSTKSPIKMTGGGKKNPSIDGKLINDSIRFDSIWFDLSGSNFMVEEKGPPK